jgi:asparagine synthase (glutamine-hydrolysing)
MCGIAGIINYKNYDLEQIKSELYHRGPDEQSIFCVENVGLIHTRLSIQDLQDGKQPFHYKSYTIIFNGEIYNHLALRELLSDFVFTTNSDTETLLYLYIKFGNKLFERLDGMFAFAIYNNNTKKIFLARDRAGKKPLYYLKVQDSFIFASELNAIKKITQLNVSEDAIYSYLRTGFFYGSFTPYKDLIELKSGHYMEVDVTNLQYYVKKYWDILKFYEMDKLSLNFADACDEVEQSLRTSIKNRMLSSDVEVGAFLSGGIDSGLIVAIASSINPNLRTFTVKTQGSFDESVLAMYTADKYATTHSTLEISMNLEKDLDSILALYGEPFMDSSAVPSFYVSRAAREQVKVVLNGDGADELFAGYRRYVPLGSSFFPIIKLLSCFKNLLPKPIKKQGLYNYIYRLICMTNKTGLDLYLSATTDIYEDVYKFQEDPITKELSIFIMSTLVNKKLTELSKFLYLDFCLLLFSDLLVKMDIATMANSVEGRSPFLSVSMLELAPRLPDIYKINGTTTKRILREIAKKYLPPQIINQPKRGFEAPLKSWIDIDLKTKILDRLQPECYSENFIKRDFIDKMLKNKIDVGLEKRAKIIWNLYCLEVWYDNEKKVFK